MVKYTNGMTFLGLFHKQIEIVKVEFYILMDRLCIGLHVFFLNAQSIMYEL